LIPREARSRLTAVVHSEGGEVNGGRKRMAMVRSEGGGVDGSRKRMTTVHSEGGEVDDLRKRMVTMCSEAGVKAVMCSEARDEAAVCSVAGIGDGTWRRHDGFQGDRRERERGVKKLLSVARKNVVPEILG
jgi:hypothetical protein